MQEGKTTEFKQVGSIVSSDTTEVILSEFRRNGKLVGYYINKYVTTEKFTGYTKGIFIPIDELTSFLMLFPQEQLAYAIEDKEIESASKEVN